MSSGSVPIRTLRGALCGALAAAVWAFEQPLDKLLLSSRYDDVELLGRAVRNGPGWYRVGLALHTQNGALFGAVYANVAPTLPIAPALRGPAVALAEHFAGWPLVALTDRFHPPATTCPRSAATSARSSRRPGATFCSGSSSASSSGASTRRPSPSPPRRRPTTRATATAPSSAPSPACETEPHPPA